MATRFNHDRPIPLPSPSQPSKPRGGRAKVLSFLLQTLVMAIALLFAGFAALVLVHLYVNARALRRRRRRFLLRSPNPNPNPNPDGLSVDELNSLPSFDCSDETLTKLENCAVCLEGFRIRDTCRSLPSCGHCFHAA